MIELFLLLLGASGVRNRWWFVGILGVAWTGLGVFFFVNAMIDEFRIQPAYFAIPLVLDGIFSLIAGLASTGRVRLLRLGKFAVLIVLALVIWFYPLHSGMIVGFLAGTFLVADAAWRATSAYMVRYGKWRRSCFYAAIELVFGLWSFIPWPTNWQGEIGADVGMVIFVSGIGLCSLARRLRRLPAGRSIAGLLNRGWPVDPLQDVPAHSRSPFRPGDSVLVTVHIWTPTGRLVPINRGLSRYVAAFDGKGTVSTGHAALETPGVYISHYPAVEIDRSASDFRRMLQASPDNDMPGRFLSSYADEIADWCPSSVQVRLKGLNTEAMADFWDGYRRDSTYNLTNRNCSSAVAQALEAGLEGIFAVAGESLYFKARLFLGPELWIAGFLRHRAAAMAWTPGLVLDYARALSLVIALPQRLASNSAGTAAAQ